MQKTTITLLIFALVSFIAGCKKDPYQLKLTVDYPIANVGENLSFSIEGSPDQGVGVRWDMGDGSPAFSGSLYNNHSYSIADTYTVTALVFLEDETITVQKEVTIKEP